MRPVRLSTLANFILKLAPLPPNCPTAVTLPVAYESITTVPAPTISPISPPTFIALV